MLYYAHQPFWRRHPVIAGTAVFLACWLLAEGWYVTVTLVAGAVLLFAIRRSTRARRVRHAGLRARAELEHRFAQWGDQRGVFGRYPPVQPGWFPDPQNRWQWRYFDGVSWTGYAVRR